RGARAGGADGDRKRERVAREAVGFAHIERIHRSELARPRHLTDGHVRALAGLRRAAVELRPRDRRERERRREDRDRGRYPTASARHARPLSIPRATRQTPRTPTGMRRAQSAALTSWPPLGRRGRSP